MDLLSRFTLSGKDLQDVIGVALKEDTTVDVDGGG